MKATMQLPGRLSDTTLGDLLGSLHREKSSGVLELIESSGRRHHVSLRDGEVESVDTGLPGPLLGDLLGLSDISFQHDERRLGEYLLEKGQVTPEDLSRALARQTRERLELLFSIDCAAVRFHAPKPRADDPTAPPHLQRAEFLHGRPRHRSRASTRKIEAAAPHRSGALRVLGLGEGATSEDIRRAFRDLAHRHHPDRHLAASPEERKRLFLRFAEISRAYHALTG
jgi:DnaJ-domain-containing protein 1